MFTLEKNTKALNASCRELVANTVVGGGVGGGGGEAPEERGGCQASLR